MRASTSKGSMVHSLCTVKLLTEKISLLIEVYRSGKAGFQQGQVVIQTYPVGKAQ